MSKKVSPEARVIEWFEQAPMATAELVLGIVRSRLKTRAAQPKPGDPSPVKPVARRKRRTKVEMAAAAEKVEKDKKAMRPPAGQELDRMQGAAESIRKSSRPREQFDPVELESSS